MRVIKQEELSFSITKNSEWQCMIIDGQMGALAQLSSIIMFRWPGPKTSESGDITTKIEFSMSAF